MKKLFLAVLLIQLSTSLFSQRKDTIPEIWRGNFQLANYSDTAVSEVDRIKIERKRAEDALRRLKSGGCLIVRLKTRQKSVNAYMKAGKTEIAESIVEAQRIENQKIYDIFKKSFFFCPVYFIYAKDTRSFLNGDKGLFLNSGMLYDSTIGMKGDFFVFVEDGPAMGDPNSVTATTRAYKSLEERRTFFIDTVAIEPQRLERATGSATGGSAICFLDKNLRPYQRPFPYASSIRLLNRQLERAYSSLVVRKDVKEKIKEIRKRQKEQWKQPGQ